MQAPNTTVAQATTSVRAQILTELEALLNNPLHQRIMKAYAGTNPVHAMEQALAAALLEVIAHED